MGVNQKWKRLDGEKAGDVSVSLVRIHTSGLTQRNLAECDVARQGQEQHGLRTLLYRYGKTGADRGFPSLDDDTLNAEQVENILDMVEANKSFFQENIKDFRYESIIFT